ncbi:MAG TPA: hypothetical protein ENI94_02500 [Gammaproteobacteria bacterium]|nr:hypothetical protein [Gammaproteobacteria bacterium]
MKWYIKLGEDFRKIAIFLVSGGFAGWIIDSDKITQMEGFMLLTFGFAVWVIGIVLSSKEVSDGRL